MSVNVLRAGAHAQSEECVRASAKSVRCGARVLDITYGSDVLLAPLHALSFPHMSHCFKL